MTEPTCSACAHWLLGADTLGQLGFGRCAARTDNVTRAAIATSAQNLCRIDRFKAASAAMQERQMQKEHPL